MPSVGAVRGHSNGIGAKPVRLATYRRISGHIDQLYGNSLLVQTELTREFAVKHGGLIVYEFEDIESGWCLTRKDYTRLIELARSDEIDAVLVFRLDRFGRNNGEAISRCDELEHKYGVRIWSVREGVDVPKMQRDMAFSMAAWESQANAQRVLPSLKKKAEMGYWPSRVPFGYRTDTSVRDERGEVVRGLLVPYEPEAGIVQTLFTRVDCGESLWNLCTWLNTLALPDGSPVRPHGVYKGKPLREKHWYVTTLRNILQNKVYIGLVEYNTTYNGKFHKREPKAEEEQVCVRGKHTPLIDEDLFERVQNKLRVNRHQRTASLKLSARGRRFVLGGLVFCGLCGKPMHGRVKERFYDEATGQLRRESTEYRCGVPNHSRIGAPALHEAVLSALDLLVLTPETIRKAAMRLRDAGESAERLQRSAARAKLSDLEQAVQNAGLHLASGVISPKRYVELVETLEDQISLVRDEIAHLDAHPDSVTLLAQAAKETERWEHVGPVVREQFRSTDPRVLDKTAEALGRLIERIEVRKGEAPRIRWKPWTRFLQDQGILPVFPEASDPHPDKP